MLASVQMNRFCSKCGNTVDDQAAFCSACGNAILNKNAGQCSPIASIPKGPLSGCLPIFFIAIILLSALKGIASHPAPKSSSQIATNAMSSDDTSCSPNNIKIKGLTGVDEDGGYARITGVLINNCHEPMGVQLKITLFDKSGNVVDTEDEWPASISNIQPHIEYPFKRLISADRIWTKYSVVPIDVKRW